MENVDFEEIRRSAIEEGKKYNLGGFLRFLDESKVYDDAIKRTILARMAETAIDPVRLYLQAARQAYLQLGEGYRHDYEKIDRTIWLSNRSHSEGAVYQSETIWTDQENNKLRKLNQLFDEQSVFCGICVFNEKPRRHKIVMRKTSDIIEHMSTNHGLVELYGCHCCQRCYTTLSELRNHDCELYRTFMISQRCSKTDYKGDLLYSIFFLICSDCGAFHSVLSRLSNNHLVRHFSSIIDFYKFHSPKRLVLACIYSEDAFQESPILSFKSSLGVDLKVSCEKCNIDMFNSAKESREHFVKHHNEKTRVKCKSHGCGAEYESLIALEEHVMNDHIKNGILAYFLKYIASIKTKGNGIMRPATIVQKERPGKLSFHVGGMKIREDVPLLRLPPENITSTSDRKYVMKMDKNMAKSMNIDPKSLDFKFADTNLKISKGVFDGKGKAKRLRMKIGNMRNCVKVNEKLLDGCDINIRMPLRIVDDNVRDKNFILRKKVGYCETCKKILNGKGVVDNHACGGEKVEVVSDQGIHLNRMIRCPKCDEKQCSINGLVFHLYNEHNELCAVLTEKFDYFTEKRELMEVSKKINRILGLLEDGSYPNERNWFDRCDIKTQTECYSLVDVDEERSLEERSEVNVDSEILIEEDNSMESRMDQSDIGNVEKTVVCSNNEANFTNYVKDFTSYCANPETEVTDDMLTDIAEFSASQVIANHPLLDEPIPSVICLNDYCESPEPGTTSCRIREENDEIIPNVVNNHTVAADEEDDDIIAIEDIATQQKWLKGMKQEHFEPNHKITMLNEGDDECMAIAFVEIQNQFEKTKSMRQAAFKCPSCSCSFITSKSLEIHKLKEHNSDFNDLWEEDHGVPLSSNVHFYLCLMCNTAFEDFDMFSAHRQKHVDKETKCELCSGIVLHQHSYKDHLKKHSLMSFVCTRCSPRERFQQESQLMYHLVNVHSINVIYFCKKCLYASPTFHEKFYMHIKSCAVLEFMQNPKITQLIGCVTASTVTYQPKNREKYKEDLKSYPSHFASVSECSHRGFVRFGDTFFTCPENGKNGTNCDAMIPQHRFNAIAELMHLDTAIHERGEVEDLQLIESEFARFAAAENNVTARKKRMNKQTDGVVQRSSVLENMIPSNVQLPFTIVGQKQDGSPMYEPRIYGIMKSRAYQITEETLAYDRFLACLFCGCDLQNLLIAVPMEHMMTLLPKIYQCYAKLPYRDGKMAHEELAVLLSRRVKIATECQVQRGHMFMLCRDHFTDDLNGHHLLPIGAIPSRLPYSIVPVMEKQSQPPIIEQIRQRIQSSSMHVPMHGSLRNRPSIPYSQNALQIEMNYPQMQNCTPRTVRIKGPLKQCQICLLANFDNRYESFVMISIADVPNHWKLKLVRELVARQMLDQSKTMAQLTETLSKTIRNNSSICVRHFLPHSYEFKNNILEYCGPIHDYPILSVENSDVLSVEFKQKFKKFLYSLSDVTMESAHYSGFITELRKATRCHKNLCGTMMKTASDLELHLLHEVNEHGFCLQCCEKFEVRNSNVQYDIAMHIMKEHRLRGLKINLKCPYNVCLDSFTSSFEFRMHLATAHRQPQMFIGVCGLGFKSKTATDLHNRAHYVAGIMNCCVLCGHVGPEYYPELSCRHEVVHAYSQFIYCNICFASFHGADNMQKYQEHFAITHVKYQRCLKCGISISGSTRTEHVRIHMLHAIFPRSNNDEFMPQVLVDELFNKYVS